MFPMMKKRLPMRAVYQVLFLHLRKTMQFKKSFIYKVDRVGNVDNLIIRYRHDACHIIIDFQTRVLIIQITGRA